MNTLDIMVVALFGCLIVSLFAMLISLFIDTAGTSGVRPRYAPPTGTRFNGWLKLDGEYVEVGKKASPSRQAYPDACDECPYWLTTGDDGMLSHECVCPDGSANDCPQCSYNVPTDFDYYNE